MTDEEQRAADYRTDQVARTNAIVARRTDGLRGSTEARAALAANWAPLVPDAGFDVPCVDDLVRPVTN